MLPLVLQQIMAVDEYAGERSEGGFFHATFLQLDSAGAQLAPREKDGSLVYKTGSWTEALDSELAASLDKAYGIKRRAEEALEPPLHRRAALLLDATPHGAVHVAVGALGRTIPGTEILGSIATAGFHPIFWMHHANVDRVYESYLRTKWGANSMEEMRANTEGAPAAEAGFPDGEWGRYAPFGTNPRTGEPYHARDTFETAGLGYGYDGLMEPPARRDPHSHHVADVLACAC